MFGSLEVVENVCNLCSSVIGGAIYSETVTFYRGTAYFVFTGFLVLAFIFLLQVFLKTTVDDFHHAVVFIEMSVTGNKFVCLFVDFW